MQLALQSMPFFGGTTPQTESSSESSTTGSQEAAPSTGNGNDTTQVAGGDSGQMSPEQIAQLLEQVNTLNANNKKLMNENNTFKAQQQEVERKSMGREQALEQDLAKRSEHGREARQCAEESSGSQRYHWISGHPVSRPQVRHARIVPGHLRKHGS
jgi:hypothetical protein